MNESKASEIDQQLQDAYGKSEGVALIPVLQLINLTTKIDLSKQYGVKHGLKSKKSKTGEILIGNKVKVYLTIVDRDYDLTKNINATKLIEENIESFNDIEEELRKQLIGMISYLTHSCLLVFNNVKEKYKELLEFTLTMDDNTTVYLEYENEKRIGVVFEDITN